MNDIRYSAALILCLLFPALSRAACTTGCDNGQISTLVDVSTDGRGRETCVDSRWGCIYDARCSFAKAWNYLLCRRPLLTKNAEAHLLDSNHFEYLRLVANDPVAVADRYHPWAEKFLTQLFADPISNKNIYDPSLAHWVVYIHKNGEVSQQLLKWNKSVGHATEATRFDGESHVWVLVFSEIAYTSATVSTEELEDYRGPGALVVDAIARGLASKNAVPVPNNTGIPTSAAQADTIVEQPLPFEPISASSKPPAGSTSEASIPLSLVAGSAPITISVGGKPMTLGLQENPSKPLTAPKSAADHSKTTKKPEPADSSAASTYLYHGLALVILNSNTQDRIKLYHFVPDPVVRSSTTITYIQTNFVNTEAGLIGAGVAAGGTFVTHPDFQPGLYLTLHLNFFHDTDWYYDKVPWAPAPFVGTNLIQAPVFTQLAAGLSFHLFPSTPKLGVDVGGNFQEHHRGGKLFLALDYQL